MKFIPENEKLSVDLNMTAIENKLDTVIELLALLIEIEAGDKLWSFGEKTRKLERIIRRSK